MENLKKLLLAFLPAILLVVLWFWYKSPSKLETDAALSEPSAPQSARSTDTSSDFESESHWLVHDIGRDITQILHFATGKPDPAEVFSASRRGENSYEFKLGDEKGLTLEIVPSHHLWSPDNYAPWVEACILHMGLKPGSDSPEEALDLRGELTNPTPATFIEHSKKVAQRLTNHPLSADAHEQAALLIGAFAMRESASMFHDPRHELNRMASHLAIAQVLRPDSGVDGEIANLIALSLVGRQQEALDGIDKLPPAEGVWARALRMRNTGDWRIPASPTSSTLMEQYELARAMNSAVGPAKVAKLMRDLKATESPEWSRIVMQHDFSVEEGHLFVRPSIKMELQEFAAAHQLWTGEPLREENVVKKLNEPPGGGAVVTREGKAELQAITWGMIAGFYQRHLCQSLVLTHKFYDDKYGVPEAAEELKTQIKSFYRDLNLYSLVMQRIAAPSDRDEYEAALTKAAALCSDHPMLVSASNWVHLRERKDVGYRSPVSVPSPNPWFTPDLPLGTTFDFAYRYYDLHQLYMAPDRFWDEIIAVAPYSYDVIRTHRYKKFGAKPTPEETLQCFERIIDFHVLAMREYADKLKGDLDAYAIAIEAPAKLDPDMWIRAGNYFLEKNRPDLALKFFETGYEKAEDRVLVSNSMRWLVDYYFDNNRQEDALKIATEGAETYSSTGLETMADLMERLGKLDEAERHHAAILSRYDDPGPLIGFYERHKATNPAYAEKQSALIPGGLDVAVLADFTAPPMDGCEFTSDSAPLREHGLKVGDVVVALDGFRVTSAEQFMTVRSLSNKLPMRLIYWNRSEYREIEVSPPDRRFQCEIGDYSP